MKNRWFIWTIIIMCILGILAAVGYKDGFKLQSNSNVDRQYNSIEELKNNTTFDFIIPNIVFQSQFISCRNIMGSMIEIKTSEYTFRAAKFINYNVEPSGNYTKTDIDNRYINEDESLYVRFRSSIDTNIITLKIQDIMYSIEYNTQIDEGDALSNLGININELQKFDIENYSSNKEIDNANNNILDSNTEDLSYKVYKSEDLNVSFMIPIIDGISIIEGTNTISIVVDTKPLISIIHYELDSNGDKTTNIEEFKDNYKEIDDEYVLVCMDNIEDTTSDTGDNTENIRMALNNIDTIANTIIDTFKHN